MSCCFIPPVSTGMEPGWDDGYNVGAYPAYPLVVTPSDTFDFTTTSLRGGGNTSLESVVTTTLGLLSIKRMVINGTESVFQLVAGVADPTDPTGQVQPLDNLTTFWIKIGGY